MEQKRFWVCQDRLSCASAYSHDYQKRIKKSSKEEQGSGNLVNDLKARLTSTGIEAQVAILEDCIGYCSRSPIVIVNGEVKPRVYWDKLDSLIKPII